MWGAESEKREQRVHISSLMLPLTALLFLTIGDLGPICTSKKLFIKTNFLSSPTLNKFGWFVSTFQILSQTGNLQRRLGQNLSCVKTGQN